MRADLSSVSRPVGQRGRAASGCGRGGTDTHVSSVFTFSIPSLPHGLLMALPDQSVSFHFQLVGFEL